MSQAKPPAFDISHVPVTFTSYFHEQLRSWETLFPAERSYFDRLAKFLEQMPAKEFEPLKAIEQNMGVNNANWPRGRFTLDQVDFLNRNAHYPAWRAEITRLFDIINPALDAQVSAKGRPRLAIISAPSDLPVGPDRMWTRFAGKGRRVKLEPPEDLSHYMPLLLTGHPDPAKGKSLAAAAAKAPYESWTIEATDAESKLKSPAIHLGYEKLKAYRTRLMDEVRRITEDQKLRGPRQLGEKLKTLQVRAGESEYSKDPVMSEFVRATLLAGNGTLLLNNTFVEWASVQAFRRARPVFLHAAFGIRTKVKPFSSLLIYTDQDSATPIPTQSDMLGSYVDLEVFYQYVWQEAEKYPEYRLNTAYVFIAEGMDELLLIAPPDFPLESSTTPLTLSAIHKASLNWLGAA